MKPICNFCTHQQSDYHGGVQCGATSYTRTSDGYGPFKQGAVCVHDSDLKDQFAPRTGAEINLANLSSMANRQRDELLEAKETIRKLQLRLITVDKSP